MDPHSGEGPMGGLSVLLHSEAPGGSKTCWRRPHSGLVVQVSIRTGRPLEGLQVVPESHVQLSA